ncbi:MAG: DUF2460 domain-containing protein [Alphaproteobacteria bacterium]|nr:DUF2460 domain-containing protein [Alphaproteobacteria bacterium]
MAFDDIEIPLRVGFGSRGGPNFSTEIIVIDSGYERRNQNWAQARRTYDARDAVRSAADAAALLNFFHARAGRARGFRLKDWSDYSSAADNISAPAFTDQTIATGDGATLLFQLIKNYSSGGVTLARPIAKPVAGSVMIGIDGAQQTTGWSIDTTTGLVTFATAPAAGQSITAGFTFDVPVRFDTDVLSLSAENYAAYQADVPIVEIRV